MSRPFSRRAMLGGLAAAALSGCTDTSAPPRTTSPRLVGSLVTRWNRDPFSRGTYAVLSPGGTWDAHKTATLVCGGCFVLAGEAFDPAHPGTVDGALTSGRKSASALLAEGGLSGGARVIVIGAGMAGLGAAQVLRAHGIDVVVLEARSRVGGRLWTDRSLGVPIERGAAWIHGLTANPLVAIAKTAGLGLVPTNYDDVHVVGTSGETVENAKVAAAQQALWDAVSEAQRQGDDQMSLQEGLSAVSYPGTDLAQWALTTEIVQEYAGDPDEISLEWFNNDAELHGGDAMVTGGYDTIATALAVGTDIRFGAVVHEVRPLRGGAEVVLANGSMTADAVIITVPVGVLRSPEFKVDWAGFAATAPHGALEHFSMGDLERVVLLFDRKVWPSNQTFGFVGTKDGRFAEGFDLSRVLGRPGLELFTAASAARSLSTSDEDVVARALDVAATLWR